MDEAHPSESERRPKPHRWEGDTKQSAFNQNANAEGAVDSRLYLPFSRSTESSRLAPSNANANTKTDSAVPGTEN